MKNSLLVVGVAIVAALGCSSGAQPALNRSASAPAWPETNPRVRFERAIETEADLGRSAFFRRLTGQGPDRLFERPYGVAWDGNDLLVTDPGAGCLVKLDEDGKVSRSAQDVLLGPVGVAPCLGGIAVADARAGRVGLFDRRLHLERWLAEDLHRPTGLTCAADGVVVVETGAHRLVILDGKGGRREIGRRGTELGEFNFPAAITAADGALWVGDTLNFRIQKIDAESGLALETFGRLGDSPGETPRIKGLAVDAGRNVWVSDGHMDIIGLFSGEGAFLMEIGGPGENDGEFSFPAGLAAHQDGRFAVVDSLNRRIQILRVLDFEGLPMEGSEK